MTIYKESGLYKRLRGAAEAMIPAPVLRQIRKLTVQRSIRTIKTIAELDEKLQLLDKAAADSDDALRQQFDTFRMEYPFRLPRDPWSEEYKRMQFELYERISGKAYDLKNEFTSLDIQSSARIPFPYTSRSSHTVGNQLIAVGHIIKVMSTHPGASVLEFGPGWGNTTEVIARMGNAVTAVDISPDFISLINERARLLSLDIKTVCDDFSYVERVNERYDVILFFESFHHASDHLRLMQNFEHALKEGGKVIFAAEPITDLFPVPWGIRLDGESLWAIRRHGWLELGFQESYFRKTMKRFGWSITKHVCADTPWGTVFVGRKA